MAVTETIDISAGVLVGHDGSAHADAALRWALKLADGMGWTVTVARGWSLQSAARPATAERGYVPPLQDFADATLERLEQDVARSGAEFPSVDVRLSVPHSGPAKALIEASARADAVVVGRRGLGGFAGLVLGSVSDQVVRHSRTAVVVVGDTD